MGTRSNRARMLLVLGLLALGSGCAAHRPPRSRAQLLELRQAHDAEYVQTSCGFVQRLIKQVKTRYDARPGSPAVVDFLVISGGGDWGAFGAGFLMGWSQVDGPLTKPQFDAVTGVSTGALISPVIFNNQLRPQPEVTEPTWPAVISRSIALGTRAATLTSIRHLFAQAEISQLKRGGEFEVRIAAVPDDFVPPSTATFNKETMNALADLGERMGADPASWRAEPP